mgnify:CR=1 FL=1
MPRFLLIAVIGLLTLEAGPLLDRCHLLRREVEGAALHRRPGKGALECPGLGQEDLGRARRRARHEGEDGGGLFLHNFDGRLVNNVIRNNVTGAGGRGGGVGQDAVRLVAHREGPDHLA